MTSATKFCMITFMQISSSIESEQPIKVLNFNIIIMILQITVISQASR